MTQIFSVSNEWGSVKMYELVRLQHFFNGKIQSTTWDIIFNQIKLNLSIYNSNQTWDLSYRSLLKSNDS